MTRDEALKELSRIYWEISHVLNSAYVSQVIGEHDKLDLRGAMYNIGSVMSGLRKEQDAEKQCQEVGDGK